MSHFTVMVIGPNPEKQLQPFHEYECTGIEDQYVVFVEAEEDIEKEYEKNKADYSSIEVFANDYYGYYKENEKWGRKTNPNRKWDWYQLGGRWSGMIQLKKGAKGKEGKSGVFANEIGIDQAKKGDIENFESLKTFAVLKDGKWYERGEMGWWGIVTDEKDQNRWDEEQRKLVESLPNNTLISIYDCHI